MLGARSPTREATVPADPNRETRARVSELHEIRSESCSKSRRLARESDDDIRADGGRGTRVRGCSGQAAYCATEYGRRIAWHPAAHALQRQVKVARNTSTQVTNATTSSLQSMGSSELMNQHARSEQRNLVAHCEQQLLERRARHQIASVRSGWTPVSVTSL